ncbi:MAG: hypothetical protein Kow0059_11510 [Candidatus Sumerlaeia bacterium]
MTDLLNEIQEKAFLGREFLTWLLLGAMKSGPQFNIKGVGAFELQFDRTIVLEGEDTGARRVTLAGSTVSIAPEVLAALRSGKLVSRARLRFLWDDSTWDVTLNGATFDFSGVRVPVPNVPEVEELFILRLRELEKFLKFFTALFHHFLALRLDGGRWKATLKEFEELAVWENAAP